MTWTKRGLEHAGLEEGIQGISFSMALQPLIGQAEHTSLSHRVYGLLQNVQLPFGWHPRVLLKHDWFKAGAIFIQVGDPGGICNVTGKPLPWWGRKLSLSPHMTDGEIVQTVFMACMVAMEHECREQFLYKGQSIFDPHYDIEKLVELRKKPDALIEREHTTQE